MKRIRNMLAAALVVCGGAAQAQNYPTETIQIVIPTTPGAGMDVTGRLFAKFLQDKIGREAIVLNKPGAQTLIGARSVAMAPPTGHVLLFSTNITNYPVFIKNPGIDVSKDLEFISTILRAPQIITVPASVPDKTIADLVARSKKRGDDFFYATYGQAIWLITEQFNRAAGIKAKALRFNGGAEAALAIERGEADYFASSYATIRGALEGNKMRMLAVTSRERNPNLPNVPSLLESGVDADDMMIWMGLFAPKGTPRPIIDRLNAIVVEFTKDETAGKFIRAQGFEPSSATPEAFRAMFIREEQNLIKIGKELGIQPE